MHEITSSIQAQVDKFVLSLGSRVTRIYDALHQLARLSELTFTLPLTDSAVKRFLQKEDFALEHGFFASRRALRQHYAGREPAAFGHFWTEPNHGDPAIRRRMAALHRILPQVAALRASLPGVAWVYYQEPTNIAAAHPFIDVSTLVDASYDWRTYPSYVSVAPENNPSRKIRWAPPSIDYGGEGLITTASLPLWDHDQFTGLWSIDVPLRTIHQNCIQERLAPNQLNFIVEHSGQIVVHDVLGAAIDREAGSVIRRHVQELGGELGSLDVPALAATGRGRLVLHDAGGEAVDVIYAAVPEIDWLFVATVPHRGLLRALNTQVAEAFEHIRRGDYSYRLDNVVPEGLEALAEGYNAMSEAIERQLTEREQVEEALAAEKERLAVTLLSIADGVIATDTRGRVVLMNRAAERITGWTFEAAKDRLLADVLPSVDRPDRPEGLDRPERPDRAVGLGPIESRPSLAERLASAARHGGPIELPTGPLTIATRHGKLAQVRVNASPIYRKGGKQLGQVVVFHDVTAEQRVAEELLKASKLESIGVLAGGIAHDFNNLLTAIVGNVSLALADTDLPPRSDAMLREAERACFRARDLSLQLLTFARGGAPVKRATSLPELLRETTRFVLRGSGIEPVLELAPDLYAAEVDEGQISQVLNNLALNAVQAMPNGGRLTVRAENVDLAVEGGDPVALRSGRYVKLSVHDTGSGITPEHLDRIFDPYFTTKPGGSGLGLATSYSIVRHHGGALTVESTPGQGSTFHVYLPALRETAVAAAISGPETLASGSGRVLVMDDDDAVRELLTRMLGFLGYDVCAAADGDEAVRTATAAAAEGKPFAVAILDLTVPGGKGGVEALRELRASGAALYAVATSGYSNDPVMADPKRHRFDAVLAKPFDVTELARCLSQARQHIT